MRPTRLAALALLIVALSCRNAVGPRLDFEEAYVRWRAQHLDTYAFTLQRSCFCLSVDPLYVLVLNDKVASVTDLQTGTEVDVRAGETVEDLFGFIKSAIDHHAARIDVEYDPSKGFPTSIKYDGSAQIVDDEIFYRVFDLHAADASTQ